MSGNPAAPELSHPLYRDVLGELNRSGLPYLVGGAYALRHYTGTWRDTFDLDVFVLPGAAPALLGALEEAGWRGEMTDPVWLGKAFRGDLFVDVIFSSRNGIARVDEEWFQHSEAGEVLGVPVRLIPPEEMIWSKAFVQERHRFDGADINHVLRVRADRMDWDRMLDRFAGCWEVLSAHLLTFAWVYPTERTKIPPWVWKRLAGQVVDLARPSRERRHLCRGTLLSSHSYQTDILEWGFRDALELVRDQEREPEDRGRAQVAGGCPR